MRLPFTGKKVTFPDQNSAWKCQCWIYHTKLGVNQYTVNVTCPWHFLKRWKYVMCPRHFLYQTINVLLDFLTTVYRKFEISLVNDIWRAVTFPILFRNLTFTWDFLGQRHMAGRYISYTVQKFGIYMRYFLGQWHIACHYISYTVLMVKNPL